MLLIQLIFYLSEKQKTNKVSFVSPLMFILISTFSLFNLFQTFGRYYIYLADFEMHVVLSILTGNYCGIVGNRIRQDSNRSYIVLVIL